MKIVKSRREIISLVVILLLHLNSISFNLYYIDCFGIIFWSSLKKKKKILYRIIKDYFKNKNKKKPLLKSFLCPVCFKLSHFYFLFIWSYFYFLFGTFKAFFVRLNSEYFRQKEDDLKKSRTKFNCWRGVIFRQASQGSGRTDCLTFQLSWTLKSETCLKQPAQQKVFFLFEKKQFLSISQNQFLSIRSNVADLAFESKKPSNWNEEKMRKIWNKSDNVIWRLYAKDIAEK